MSYLGNNWTKTLTITGGIKTPDHIKSGGYRYDIKPEDPWRRALEDYKYISSGSLGTKDGWVCYQIIGTSLYIFYVHIKDPHKGNALRGQFVVKPYEGKGWAAHYHIHIKQGGYTSSTTKYINWIEYLDPSIKIQVIPGVDKSYIGKNTGKDLPGTPISTKPIPKPPSELEKAKQALLSKEKELQALQDTFQTQSSTLISLREAEKAHQAQVGDLTIKNKELELQLSIKDSKIEELGKETQRLKQKIFDLEKISKENLFVKILVWLRNQRR